MRYFQLLRHCTRVGVLWAWLTSSLILLRTQQRFDLLVQCYVLSVSHVCVCMHVVCACMVCVRCRYVCVSERACVCFFVAYVHATQLSFLSLLFSPLPSSPLPSPPLPSPPLPYLPSLQVSSILSLISYKSEQIAPDESEWITQLNLLLEKFFQ